MVKPLILVSGIIQLAVGIILSMAVAAAINSSWGINVEGAFLLVAVGLAAAGILLLIEGVRSN